MVEDADRTTLEGMRNFAGLVREVRGTNPELDLPSSDWELTQFYAPLCLEIAYGAVEINTTDDETLTFTVKGRQAEKMVQAAMEVATLTAAKVYRLEHMLGD